ncbi:hypothetical protein COCCADRAFT_83157 [Bipolaris zeicola 26-R-13]|uniref:Uncharacterized protein n=1 Tax=Cochliobolus carbonum (strain 26-R-13) TaxID=930089 RepID=W6YSN2_COCC2|nr:uncharacterized protein COCCADRAFT_83157 [Bipolaris zeicola 26-R-13]EUC38414.1 hypothetical protein COCCADRAFT_83157 [Bipolaris zeicola 26-R-13]
MAFFSSDNFSFYLLYHHAWLSYTLCSHQVHLKYTSTPSPCNFLISYQVKSCFVCYRRFTPDYTNCALISTPSNHSLTHSLIVSVYSFLFRLPHKPFSSVSECTIYFSHSHQNKERGILTTRRSLLHLTTQFRFDSSTYNSI